LSFRLKSRAAWNRRIARVDPPTFRRTLTIDAGRPCCFGDVLEPWQEVDFRALDPAWLQLAGFEARARHRRAYVERPRGHSKTTDLAVMSAWLLAFSLRRVEGIAAAADQEQASLLLRAVDRLLRVNAMLSTRLQRTQVQVHNPETGSRLDVISSDVKSSYGALPDFVICDELCHWRHAELWHSLLSAAAKRPHCVLVAISNAGAGRGWHWDVREAARQNPNWYFVSLDGPQARWITESDLAEQAALLPPSTYARLWLNQWQETAGDFVTLAEAEACRDLDWTEQRRGVAGVEYVAALDFAEKHDYSVGVVVHRHGTRIVVDRMDVVRPEPERPTPVAWVENWIEQIAGAFGRVTFVIDEYQLLAVIQRFEERHAIHRFEFRAGLGNYQLASNLRRLILNKQVGWYAGCGRLDVPWGRDDLETELASVVVRETGGGRWRIDHLADATHHDDRVFALGAACLYCVQHPASEAWMEVTPPGADGGFGE
jgi:hypothetical protein